MQFLAEEGMADQIPEALRRATAYGHLDAVKWVMEHFPSRNREQDVWVLEVAVLYGRMDIVQYLDSLTVPIRSTKPIDLAAEHGHSDILQWLHDVCDGHCSTNAMDSAATNGHFEVVKYIAVKVARAAKNGHLEILKWLYRHRSEGCTPKAIVDAAENSHARVVEWLLDHYPDLTPRLRNLVIHPPNQFEMLFFLRETFPSTFRQGNSERPRSRLVHESNDEHVKAWLQQEYSSF